MRPGLAAKELLGNILDSFSTRRLVKRDKAQKRCRAQGTKAWNARLRATRPARTISRRTRSNQVREPQLQSPFFGKLPLELRMLIYTYALAEQELLFQVINEETGRNCDETGNMDVPFHLVCNTAQALLSFPLSCTIAYVGVSVILTAIAAANHPVDTKSPSNICTQAIHSV